MRVKCGVAQIAVTASQFGSLVGGIATPQRPARISGQAGAGGALRTHSNRAVRPLQRSPKIRPSARCRVYMATRFYKAMRENAFTIVIAAICVFDVVIIWLLLAG